MVFDGVQAMGRMEQDSTSNVMIARTNRSKIVFFMKVIFRVFDSFNAKHSIN